MTDETSDLQHDWENYRNLDSKIWKNEKFISLDVYAQLLFLQLLLDPDLNKSGQIHQSIQDRSNLLKEKEVDFSKAFNDCVQVGFLCYDEHNQIISIVNIMRFLKIDD